MADLGRRDFLKLMGIAGTGVVVGSPADSKRKLIPFIDPPEDVIPGASTWYATTCRECPAGCGLLAKNRDGHVIKVEGNPLHPINGGKLCARGQASLHGLYNPDRFRQPMQRTPKGEFDAISWEQGQEILVQRLQTSISRGRGERIVFVSDLLNGSLRDLVHYWLSELGSKEHLMYEPFAYEPLRKANETVFGVDGIPSYRIDTADYLISFGAGFLETWLSNVEYARQFAAFHAPQNGTKKTFVHVGPRLSMTAANADVWIPVAPGHEYLVALGLMKIILADAALAGAVGEERRNALKGMVDSISLEEIVGVSGVPEAMLRMVAQQFARAQRPLALAEGLSSTRPNAMETAVAANLLCTLLPGTRETLDFGSLSAYSEVARAEAVQELTKRMRDGDVDLLLIYNANPLYALPPSWNFGKAMEDVPFVVSFSSALDETTQGAQLILPSHTPLESWGDYSPRKGVTGLLQPVMGPVFQTRHLGDMLLDMGRRLKGPERFPWPNFHEALRSVWQEEGKKRAPDRSPEEFWQEAVRRGGVWEDRGPVGDLPSRKKSRFAFSLPEAPKGREEKFYFVAYPTIQFFDGRGANKPWLQELPDPMAQVTWGAWVEINLERARELDIHDGDLLRIRSPYGSIELPAFPLLTVPRDVLAVPIGQGHTVYGRYADVVRYGNPFHLLPAEVDRGSGGPARPAFRVTLDKRGRTSPVAHTDGSLYQHDRGFVRVATLAEYQEGIAAGHKPHLYMPLPEGYDNVKDFYPPHEHVDYRWAMVVDLDRCIGCGACVIGCYAENNVAIVGKKQVLRGREMSWLRVQRYFEQDRPAARFLPMLCQHCDNAPCEAVCPVYAPHHSVEGLNNQVYNRCFGTRFCSQNCPYKVRRFNWFTFTRAEPLHWQLNPDVTVRQKGVMEKCSFCIQRIVEAKQMARNKGRKVQDGDFTTACAQTCPTDALVFGNLLDPDSRVSRMIKDTRTYQVLDHLNTKPAVFYLKRLTPHTITA